MLDLHKSPYLNLGGGGERKEGVKYKGYLLVVFGTSKCKFYYAQYGLKILGEASTAGAVTLGVFFWGGGGGVCWCALY
jgi:hypothetical protein